MSHLSRAEPTLAGQYANPTKAVISKTKHKTPTRINLGLAPFGACKALSLPFNARKRIRERIVTTLTATPEAKVETKLFKYFVHK